MARFVVARTFPEGLEVSITESGARRCLAVIENNAEECVTWLTSYVTTDRRSTFCIYDGPCAAAVRRAAVASGFPVDTITEVRVLDPYFYVCGASSPDPI